MADVEFALVLNLHQPPGNLEHLLDEQEWQAKEILWAIDRIPRSLWPYEDIARVHLSLSGSLLETLANPDFQRRVYGIVDCGSLLWYLQNTRVIELLGTGYYHPVLPLIRSDRPGGAPAPLANDRRPSLCRAITSPGSGRPSWASRWTSFPPCAATATAM